MNNQDRLDQEALASAKRYMGGVAWPTVCFAVLVFSAYGLVLTASLAGMLSLWLATPFIAMLTYLSYTVMHEAAHGTITGNQQNLRWLNEALGYAAGWVLMMPLTAHRHEHLAHHRNTNDKDSDPDYHIGEISNTPIEAIRAAAQVFQSQFSFYFEHRWSKAPARQNLQFCAEIAVSLLPRIAVLAAGFWVEGALLFGVAWLLGVALTLYLFAYLVHRPHDVMGRYIDTSTVLLPGRGQRLLNWVWVFQNYHSIHHLFPRVPFYQYEKLYQDIEPVMVAKGAPVYRLSVRGLEPREAQLV